MLVSQPQKVGVGQQGWGLLGGREMLPRLLHRKGFLLLCLVEKVRLAQRGAATCLEMHSKQGRPWRVAPTPLFCPLEATAGGGRGRPLGDLLARLGQPQPSSPHSC